MEERKCLCTVLNCHMFRIATSWMKMTPLTQTGNQSRVFVIESLTLLYLIPLPNCNLLPNQTAVTFGSNKSISKTRDKQTLNENKMTTEEITNICQRFTFLAGAPLNSKGTLLFVLYSTITNSNIKTYIIKS